MAHAGQERRHGKLQRDAPSEEENDKKKDEKGNDPVEEKITQELPDYEITCDASQVESDNETQQDQLLGFCEEAHDGTQQD